MKPVAAPLALGEQADLVVVPDRPGRDADERRGVADQDLTGRGRERVHGCLSERDGTCFEQTT